MWMLVAYCHLRQSIRHFLLRRLQAIELLDKTFTPPADFDLRTYTTGDDRHLTVRLEIESRLVTRIKEYNFYYMEAMEELGDGGAIATLRVKRGPEHGTGALASRSIGRLYCRWRRDSLLAGFLYFIAAGGESGVSPGSCFRFWEPVRRNPRCAMGCAATWTSRRPCK